MSLYEVVYVYEVATQNLQSETNLFLPFFQICRAIPYNFILLSEEYFIYSWKASLRIPHCSRGI